MKPTTLVLWDIDRTLIWGGSAGEHALVAAAKIHFEQDLDLAQVPYSGRTDRWIARAISEHFSRTPNDELEQTFLASYIEHLGKILPQSNSIILPGVLELVKALDAEPTVCQALLTGNLAEGARLKLDQVGLWEYFPFGAFADHSSCRNDLSAHALTLARDHLGYNIEPSRVFVIGDTPHDLECGKIIGAKTIAVATGCHSMEELSQHDPDFLFDSLEDHQHVFDTIKDCETYPC